MMKLVLIAGLFISFLSYAEEVEVSEIEDKALTQATESMMKPEAEESVQTAPAVVPAATVEKTNEKEISTKKIEDDSSLKKEEQIPAFREAQVKVEKPQSMWGRLVLSFLVVAAVAVGLILATRRWAKKRNTIGGVNKVKINHQLHLGPKKSIALIEVAGEHLLIGVTDHNINLLKTLSIINDEIPENVPQNFADALDEDFQFGKNYDARMN